METLVAVIVALLVGGILDTGTALTGTQKPFCERYLKGTYTPEGPDVCPDGQWSALVGIWVKPVK